MPRVRPWVFNRFNLSPQFNLGTNLGTSLGTSLDAGFTYYCL